MWKVWKEKNGLSFGKLKSEWLRESERKEAAAERGGR
jgi:hypothetical protein